MFKLNKNNNTELVKTSLKVENINIEILKKSIKNRNTFLEKNNFTEEELWTIIKNQLGLELFQKVSIFFY